MDNNELLMQVLAAMQEQTEVLTKMVDSKIKDAETRINLKIENEVTKRIDSLVGGFFSWPGLHISKDHLRYSQATLPHPGQLVGTGFLSLAQSGKALPG